jgi:hypothetical protein
MNVSVKGPSADSFSYCTQVAALQVLALIVAVYKRQEHGELAIDVASPAELSQQLVQKLPESSGLRASATAIIRLMIAECSAHDTETLCGLLDEEWMTPALFAACLSHILPRSGLNVCLESLKKAIHKHRSHAAVLCESLSHVQVSSFMNSELPGDRTSDDDRYNAASLPMNVGAIQNIQKHHAHSYTFKCVCELTQMIHQTVTPAIAFEHALILYSFT